MRLGTLKILTCLIALAFGLNNQAQEQGESAINRIALMKKIVDTRESTSIYLRWAPATPTLWDKCNTFGYRIERAEMLPSGETVAGYQVINEQVLPSDLDAFKALSESDEKAFVAAECIHAPSSVQGSDMASSMKRQEEINWKFSMLLAVSDQSFKVAQASGLGFVDNKIEQGKSYMYRVSSLAPDSIITSQSGFVHANTLEVYEALPPANLVGTFGDRTVSLKWDRPYGQPYYSSWVVERSLDGKTFEPTHEQPYIYQTESGELTYAIFRMDSLPENYLEYKYRVLGIDPFGMNSAASNVIKGTGYPNFKTMPEISEIDESKQGATINWTFAESGVKHHRGYQVRRATTEDGDYALISEALLPTEQQFFLDTNPESSNYYQVIAIGDGERTSKSFNKFFLATDSIPPAAPIGLTGHIDSLGQVTIDWEANSEKDLLGYRVYFSHFPDREFIQLTVSPIETNQFLDSIPLNNLTGTIYYQVRAVDFRHNPSEFSEMLELVKPDLIPPTPPVLMAANQMDQGLSFEWIPSSSLDVKSHALYRRDSGAEEWILIDTLALTEKSLIDTTTTEGGKYQYRLIAVDLNGLESEPTPAIIAAHIKVMVLEPIEEIIADRTETEILLKWSYEQALSRILVYKAEGDGKLSLMTAISGDEQSFQDKGVKEEKPYSYRLVGETEDGRRTSISEEVSVEPITTADIKKQEP